MTFEPKPGQLPPNWDAWGMSAGRGAGKSRAALEYFSNYMTETEGARGLIVVPHASDIYYTVEHLLRVEPKIVWRPSIRRLEWTSSSAEGYLRQEYAREALARVQDLPARSRVRIYAEMEYNEAVAAAAKSHNTVAYITSSDEPDSIRGLQSHLTLLEDVQNFAELNTDEYASFESSIGAFELARIATRLGREPKMIVTHTPGIDPIDGVTYTML